MPIKVSIVTTGTDFPRNSRAQWEGDIGFDYSNVSKVITVANTETSCEQAIYFADEDALTAHRTANLEKIVGLNNRRSSNSMVTVIEEEVVETIP